MFYQFLFNLAGWKSFAGNNDSPADIVVTNESGIGSGFNVVAGKHFCTDCFHQFDVICIQNGDFQASASAPCGCILV